MSWIPFENVHTGPGKILQKTSVQFRATKYRGFINHDVAQAQRLIEAVIDNSVHRIDDVFPLKNLQKLKLRFFLAHFLTTLYWTLTPH